MNSVNNSSQKSFSTIQPYGFSSNYNPYDNQVITTGTIAGVGGIGFGAWLASLFFSPRKVLKTNSPEQVSIFNSDTDYFSDDVTLNALTLGKIDASHEIFNWNVFRNENNTLGVFYLEIPLQLDQVEKIDRIEIK